MKPYILTFKIGIRASFGHSVTVVETYEAISETKELCDYVEKSVTFP